MVAERLGTLLKMDSDTLLCKDTSAKTVGDVFSALEEYQKELDIVQVKDERFRRIANSKGKRPSNSLIMRIIAYRFMVCVVLGTICLPGLIMWSPCWIMIKRKERELLKKGAGWVDSLAETKMTYGLFFLMAIGIGMLILLEIKYILFFLAYLWLTMRLFEDGMANARSIFGLVKLGRLSDQRIDEILKLRANARSLCNEALALFPKTSAERIMEECGDDVYLTGLQDHDKLPRWYTTFNPLRRRKKDWNELLRLSDYCTMDYVE